MDRRYWAERAAHFIAYLEKHRQMKGELLHATCDQRIRKALVEMLSQEGVTPICQSILAERFSGEELAVYTDILHSLQGVS